MKKLPAEGGRYMTSDDDTLVLVERTNWTPDAAPEPVEIEETPEMNEDDYDAIP